MKLRELLDQEGTAIVAPGVNDVLTAKLIESLGFNALYLGGWVTGAHYGTTEPLLTLSEMTELAFYIAKSTQIPLIVDIGAGWGEPLHVMRTVADMERAGAQAIHLEDAWFPKRASYHKGIRRVIPKDEMVAKIEAAVEARRSPDLVIIARTDCWSADDESSIDEVIDRMQAYRAAGADALMPMVKQFDKLPLVRAALPGIPLVWTQYFQGPTIQEIVAQGPRIILFPKASVLVGLKAVKEVFQEVLRTGRIESFSAESDRPMTQELLRLLGMEAYFALEARTTERRKGLE